MAAATSVPPDLNLVLFSSDVYVLTLHTYMLTAAPGARWGGKGDLRGSEKETRLSIYSNIEDAGSRNFWAIERQAQLLSVKPFCKLAEARYEDDVKSNLIKFLLIRAGGRLEWIWDSKDGEWSSESCADFAVPANNPLSIC